MNNFEFGKDGFAMSAKKDAEHFLSASKHGKLKLVRGMLAEKIGEEKPPNYSATPIKYIPTL